MRTRCPAAFAVLLAVVAPHARADGPSHREAAENLLQAMNMEKQMQSALDEVLSLQVKTQPALAPYKDVMKKFLNKHLSYAALKDELIKIYVEEFTETELRQATAFYKTPAGKKMAEKNAALMARSMKLGEERVRLHQDELRKMIEDEVKKPKDK